MYSVVVGYVFDSKIASDYYYYIGYGACLFVVIIWLVYIDGILF